jgi:addiction module antidote protein, HigA family
MTNNVRVAESFPPGDLIKEELEARGWTQTDLADVLGRPARLVSELVNGKRAITPDTAAGLADAFGTSAQFWMNMDSAWQLSKVARESNLVARRASLYSRFPVKDMIRRGWVEGSTNLDVLEARFAQFFALKELSASPELACSFRKSGTAIAPNPAQLGWVFRAKHLAESMVVPKFTDATMVECLEKLRPLMASPEEIRHVPRVLSEAGIRFVLVEQLVEGARIDGVCFKVKNSPAVALSMRLDRIDYFWFTLLHELRHVANRDWVKDAVLDIDLVGEQADRSELPSFEIKADEEASASLINPSELHNFILRVKPLYSEERISGFAKRIGVHPGIVVGRLHWMSEIPYANLRRALVRVRQYLLPAAKVDGWGHTPGLSS